MPVEVSCPNCRKKLRAPSKFVNRQVKCPHCKKPFAVQASTGAEQAATAQPSQQTAGSNGSNPTDSGAKWHVQTGDGQQYGPVSKSELDNWMTEGRLDDKCQVLQEGWEQWKWADDVYPALSPATATANNAAQTAGIANPVANPAGAQVPVATPPGAAPVNFATSQQGLPVVAAPDGTGTHVPQAVAPTFGVPAATGGAPAGSPFDFATDEKPGANPYSPPQAVAVSGGATPAAAGSASVDDPAIRRALERTSPWVLFLSILGFIGFGMTMLGIFMYVVASLFSGSIGVIMLMAGVGLLYAVVITAIYGVPSYLMMGYFRGISKYRSNRDHASLVTALDAQRKFWQYAGIMVIVMFCLSVISVIGMFVFGASMFGIMARQVQQMVISF